MQTFHEKHTEANDGPPQSEQDRLIDLYLARRAAKLAAKSALESPKSSLTPLARKPQTVKRVFFLSHGGEHVEFRPDADTATVVCGSRRRVMTLAEARLEYRKLLDAGYKAW